MQDQTFSLPKQIQKDILELHHNYANDGSKEGIISRDADLLEHGFKARELMVLGNSAAKDWIDNVNKLVKTDTAKTIAKSLYTSDPNEWLKGLKNIKR